MAPLATSLSGLASDPEKIHGWREVIEISRPGIIDTVGYIWFGDGADLRLFSKCYNRGERI